jgi:hypothetical protein
MMLLDLSTNRSIQDGPAADPPWISANRNAASEISRQPEDQEDYEQQAEQPSIL